MTPNERFERRLAHILAMTEAEILVIGDLLLDCYVFGKVSRISPEAPVPVVLQETERAVLGGAGNVAANIAAFGGRVGICGRLGKDADADVFVNLCRSFGIGTEWLVHSEVVPTSRKTRILAGYQQIVRVDREVQAELLAAEQAAAIRTVEAFVARAAEYKAVVISDYAKGFLTRSLVVEVIKLCRQAGVPTLVDPKSADLSRYAGCTVIKPDRREGQSALRALQPSFASQANNWRAEAEAICDCFINSCRAQNVVLSLSERGVFVKGNELEEPISLPSKALTVADVSGAGDTMVAFLAMAVAARVPLQEAAFFGNLAAGIVCGKQGTATTTMGEFLAVVQHDPTENGEHKAKILQRAEAARIIAKLRANKSTKIVFTNGCFDILHAGHVQLLQKARGLGDILVVGLNSDASVKRLKGNSRPLQIGADRAEVLAALACTDFVVQFDEDTPLELIKEIKPDVLVKGGDYNAETIVGSKEVREWGGEIAIIPLLEGRSTTSIVARELV